LNPYVSEERVEPFAYPGALSADFLVGGTAVTGQPDRWIRRTTIGCVGMLAVIAGTVSYLHMHLLVQLHGQPGWVAALTRLSVDGMIVAASPRSAHSGSGPARPAGGQQARHRQFGPASRGLGPGNGRLAAAGKPM
jgi:hypothetical protein